jgi:coenzyme PQQ precursor peptide PqqA
MIPATLNVLIPRRFGIPAARRSEFLLRCSIVRAAYDKRFHWRTFRSALVYPGGRISSGFARRAKMAWKTPKIVEVPVGMEINMYACAVRK